MRTQRMREALLVDLSTAPFDSVTDLHDEKVLRTFRNQGTSTVSGCSRVTQNTRSIEPMRTNTNQHSILSRFSCSKPWAGSQRIAMRMRCIPASYYRKVYAQSAQYTTPFGITLFCQIRKQWSRIGLSNQVKRSSAPGMCRCANIALGSLILPFRLPI